MIVASSRGTATIIDGRARARTSAPIATRYSTGGTCRRQAGVRGTRFDEQVDVRERDRVAGAAPLDEEVGGDGERDEEEPEEELG